MAIIRTVVLNEETVNDNQYPGTRCLLLIQVCSSGFQPRSQALPPPRQPNCVAAFGNESDPSLGQFMDTTVSNSQVKDASELDAHEYLGNWNYHCDYEPGHEGYDCLDDFDLGPGEGETTPQSVVSVLTESPRDTSTADQFLLPCEQFTQPWLTLLPTEMTAPLSTDFKANPEVPTSDQTLENSHSDYPFQEDTTGQLDPDRYDVPPPSDEEYSSNDENECKAMFNLPAPVLIHCGMEQRHTHSADNRDLRHQDIDSQTPPLVMVVNLPPEDVKLPPYPGIKDVYSPDLSEPWELQEIVVERPSPRSEKRSPTEVVSRKRHGQARRTDRACVRVTAL